MEIENARLEAAAKQQANKIDALQKGAQEAAMVSAATQPAYTHFAQDLSGTEINFLVTKKGEICIMTSLPYFKVSNLFPAI